MKTCISITIYGTDQVYSKCVKELSSQCVKFNINLIIYADNHNYELFKNLENIILCKINKSIPIKLTRYLCLKDFDFDYYLVRDSDYYLTDREISIINDWKVSEYFYMAIRDHKSHTDPLMAGLVSIKKEGKDKFISCLLNNINAANKIMINNTYRYDQIFLSKYVYLKIKKNLLVYTTGNIFKKEFYKLIKPANLKEYVIGSIENPNQRDLNLVYFNKIFYSYVFYRILGCRNLYQILESLKRLLLQKNSSYK